jgi:heme-degrading monooxygenase HmoA
MVRTVLSMLVREGCEREFEQAWRRSAERIARHPGNLGQTLSYDVTQRRVFVIASDWESREALQDFERSSDRIALSARLEELRESASKSVQQIIATVKENPERSRT